MSKDKWIKEMVNEGYNEKEIQEALELEEMIK